MTTFSCRICRSILREKIEEEVGRGMGFREVAHQYLDNFDCTLHGLEQSMAVHQKKHLTKNSSHEFIPEELNLLERLKKGEVALEEASRVVAVKVFEKMLRNPGDVKFIDFFRTELLKIKQQETNDKNSWAMELINRMFAGQLPPRNCPNCGYELVKISSEATAHNGVSSL